MFNMRGMYDHQTESSLSLFNEYNRPNTLTLFQSQGYIDPELQKSQTVFRAICVAQLFQPSIPTKGLQPRPF